MGHHETISLTFTKASLWPNDKHDKQSRNLEDEEGWDKTQKDSSYLKKTYCQ